MLPLAPGVALNVLVPAVSHVLNDGHIGASHGRRRSGHVSHWSRCHLGEEFWLSLLGFDVFNQHFMFLDIRKSMICLGLCVCRVQALCILMSNPDERAFFRKRYRFSFFFFNFVIDQTHSHVRSTFLPRLFVFNCLTKQSLWCFFFLFSTLFSF